MFSSLRRSGLLTAVAAILGAGYSVTAMANQPTMVSVAPRPVQAGKRSLFGGQQSTASRYGRKGAGITMAQQQRGARKKLGVSRNRQHHR